MQRGPDAEGALCRGRPMYLLLILVVRIGCRREIYR